MHSSTIVSTAVVAAGGGVSIRRILVQGGLCPGGLCPVGWGGLSVQRGDPTVSEMTETHF